MYAAALIGVPLVLLAIQMRDIVLFHGTVELAVEILSILIQVEATVGAVVVTILFVFVELTASSYTPRLAILPSSRRSFMLMLLAATVSLVAKIGILSFSVAWATELDTTGGSPLIDGALLLTISATFGHILFVRDALGLLSPEKLAAQTLEAFDERWIQLVRQEWSSRTEPHFPNIDRDPLVGIERILVGVLERGDVNSFLTTTTLLWERVRDVGGEHDGAPIDAYLSQRLSSVAKVAGDRRAQTELSYLCDMVADITTPSDESLHNSDAISIDGAPVGCRMLRKIVEHSMAAHLPEPAIDAIYAIDRVALRAVEALPPYSDLWILNDDNLHRNLPEPEQETLRRNEQRVNNYIDGYVSYFGKIGQQAIEENMPDVSRAASRNLSANINAIARSVQEERYQLFLIRMALFSLDVIVRSACRKGLLRAVNLGLMDFGAQEVAYHDVALAIADRLSDFVRAMASAGILDLMTVIEVTVTTVSLALNNPDVVLPVIDGLGQAGESLQAVPDSIELDSRAYVRREILERIAQLERSGLRPGIMTRVRRAAGRARRRIRA